MIRYLVQTMTSNLLTRTLRYWKRKWISIKSNVKRFKEQNSDKHELIIKLEVKISTIMGELEISKENYTEMEHMYNILKNTIFRLDSDIIRLEREIFDVREKKMHCIVKSVLSYPKSHIKVFHLNQLFFKLFIVRKLKIPSWKVKCAPR